MSFSGDIFQALISIYPIAMTCVEAIRSILSRGCTTASCVRLTVNNYSEVLALWNSYKNTGRLQLASDERITRSIFDFHKVNRDHVILYYSRGQPCSVLLCRVGGRYINMVISVVGPRGGDVSCVATYV